MRSSFYTILLAAMILVTAVLAKPLPMSDDEIQRRWSRGESEATIHAADTHRDATPAWPVTGRGGDLDGYHFTYATDERTMELHKQKRDETNVSADLLAKMKAFVWMWYKSQGKKVNPSKTEQKHSTTMGAEGEAPVLKPKKHMKYHFTA